MPLAISDRRLLSGHGFCLTWDPPVEPPSFKDPTGRFSGSQVHIGDPLQRSRLPTFGPLSEA